MRHPCENCGEWDEHECVIDGLRYGPWDDHLPDDDEDED